MNMLCCHLILSLNILWISSILLFIHRHHYFMDAEQFITFMALTIACGLLRLLQCVEGMITLEPVLFLPSSLLPPWLNLALPLTWTMDVVS